MDQGLTQQPWEVCPDVWKTKAAFFAYIRGIFRLAWKRYPPKIKWKTAQMVKPPVGYTGRAKSLGTCHYCKEQFAASHLEVDHVEQAGTCSSWETASEFLYKLLDCNSNWVLACKPCHKVKSYAERTGSDFATALAEKRAIEYSKKSLPVVLDFCKKNGYTEASLSNATKRRKALSKIFAKEN